MRSWHRFAGETMDINQIRSFLTVAQTLNFTDAARRNNVPQSTVSRQIESLETQLGAPLFYRTKREVKLTVEGQIFLPYAREMLEASVRGAEAVRQLHEGAAGHLSIAAAISSGRYLAGVLRRFSDRYPQIVVDIAQVSGGRVLQEEDADTCDFYFLQKDMIMDTDEFESMDIYRDRLGLAVAKGHPMAGKPADPGMLRHERFVIMSETEEPILYMHTMELCQTYRFTPQIVNHFESMDSLLLAVASGMGVTVLPVSVPEENCSGLVEVIPFGDDGPELEYAVCWRKKLVNPAAKLFLEVLKTADPG